MHDVLEVLQSDLSVLSHAAPEHVLQPLQVLLSQLAPRAGKEPNKFIKANSGLDRTRPDKPVWQWTRQDGTKLDRID